MRRPAGRSGNGHFPYTGTTGSAARIIASADGCTDQPGGDPFTLVRTYTFPGGCVSYQFSFAVGAAPSLAVPLDTAVAFQPRPSLVSHVRQAEGLALCGLGASCPG
jgi:hypothetical protein